MRWTVKTRRRGGEPLLDLERALNAAEHPDTRLCVLCGCTQKLTPLLRGFDHTGDSYDY